jgi:hypothetical protein
MTSFTLRLQKHSPFLCASNRSLDDNASPRDDLSGFDGNLLSKLSGGRDDNRPDIVGFGALVASNLLAELWVALDDALNDGDEETECFAGTSLCLCNAAVC